MYSPSSGWSVELFYREENRAKGLSTNVAALIVCQVSTYCSYTCCQSEWMVLKSIWRGNGVISGFWSPWTPPFAPHRSGNNTKPPQRNPNISETTRNVINLSVVYLDYKGLWQLNKLTLKIVMTFNILTTEQWKERVTWNFESKWKEEKQKTLNTVDKNNDKTIK